MRSIQGIKRSILLVVMLFLGTGASFISHPQSTPSDINPAIQELINEADCNKAPFEQEIPDDGSWLTICWNDVTAPEKATVAKNHVQYIVDHPDVSQLEVQLIHGDVSYILWDKEALKQGRKFGEELGLDAFRGAPSQGSWYLLIRDIVPSGDKGKLLEFTIVPFYAPVDVGLETMTESSGAGEPTIFSIPPDAVEVKPLDTDPVKSSPRVTIKGETFEGAFPNSSWTLFDLNPNDGMQYLWDDDNYRFHNGTWAAWPANGGTNALNPSVSAYPPNMDSMMKYGPFDLSDAATAQTSFWLWRYMQANYDYLKFGISGDGTNFQGFTYSGIANTWQQITISMNNYVGDSSVWVAWEFVSNASVQYEGPWVDDITISKEAPGYVNVYGTLTYKGRDNLSKPAANTLVKLMEDDPSGIDDVLGGTFTNDAGYYSFTPVLNWDGDGDADTSNRNLDLYVVFESSNSDYKVTEVFASINHRWETPLSSNVSSTGLPKNLYIYSPTDRLGAMWLFHDLKRARDFVINQAGINPGFATTTWQYQNNCDIYNTCNGPAYFSPGIGIFVPENSLVSVDTIVHEIGHHFLYNLSGPVNGSCPSQHYITQISNINCAWKEGWAEFFPIVVNLSLSSSDVCYDFASGNCSNQSVNLETVNPVATGDTVEGRVAAALLDLYDINNEGYDSASFGFSPIAQVSMQGASEHSLWDFWNSWKASGYDRHNAVRAIYQNAINYNNTPTLISLPDWSVPHDSSWSNVFNLLGYASDVETSTSLLAWQITSISDSRCGVSIDAQKNIDIVPQANWQGLCDITVSVSDSIASNPDTFRVTITQASFSDVATSYWAYSFIERVFASGITGGCFTDPRRYCPEDNVTRAQMAVFLLRGIHGAAYTPPAATGTVFGDVPISHWAAAWIERLAQEGITGGCGGGLYCPENAATRAQMAVFLLRAKHGAAYVPPAVNGTSFLDVPATYWADDWIAQLVAEGIASGCGNGYFCPDAPTTRAQMAVMLVRTFNLP